MAEDVASLGLEIRSQGVKEASEQLENFSKAAVGAEKASNRYVDAAGRLREANGRFAGAAAIAEEAARGASGALGATAARFDQFSDASGRAERSASAFTGGLGFLKGALAGVFAGFSISALGSMADEWSDLTARVNIASGSLEKGTAVMGRLQKMANATYSSLRTTTEGYIANATTLRGMGKSTQEALDYTEALNNAMVVSGAKAERAAAVQGALSKAMALGKLSGDNLNTVIQQGGRVAELLAEKLGTTVPGLIAMGQQGKITGEVITTSLIDNMDKLAEQADSMPAAIGDAFQRIQNNALSTVGSFDKLFGASEGVAGALLVVADNIDRVIVTLATATVGFGTYYVGALAAAAIATHGLTGALRLLKTALISTGVGALVVVAGELVYILMKARQASESWGDAFSAVAKRLSGLWQGIKYAWYGMIDYMEATWYGFLSLAVSGAQKAVNAITSIFGQTFTGFDGAIADFAANEESFRESAATLASGAVDEFRKAFAAFSEEDVASLGGDGGLGSGGALGEAGGKDKKGKDKKSHAAERLKREMEERLEVLTEYHRAEEDLLAEKYLKDIEALNWARENEKISQDEYNAFKLGVEAKFQADLQAIKLQEFSSTGDFFGAMSALQAGGNEKMLKAQKIFAAASALVNAYLAATQALATPGIGPWGQIAAYASVLAAGLGAVAAIKGGGKSSSGGGGGGSVSSQPQASAAPPEKKPINTQAVEIKLHGEVFTRAAVEELMNKMNDLSSDGFKLIIGTT